MDRAERRRQAAAALLALYSGGLLVSDAPASIVEGCKSILLWWCPVSQYSSRRPYSNTAALSLIPAESPCSSSKTQYDARRSTRHITTSPWQCQ
ncbi:hypothetical protein BDV96DRAFT_592088 [Lophiotrema nucula]|uniref:Secreted protein n=1 Tax=Lophiotrema nucula TaxID=690887 RepID=A0A6A5YEJ5_9PLEO|nr:hypothetical protein BDV96DRAFT_592088 [Lophiotrema nucula]